jgi:hypothetical protein
MITIEPISQADDFTIDLVYGIFKEVGDRIPPVLGALYIQDFYTAKKMVFEHFWFVLEAERRSGAGLKLYRAFKKTWEGFNTVWMGQNKINSPEGLERFYEREGFINWATTFRKVINHG